MSDEQRLKDSIFIIGRVISVEGRIVKIDVDKKKNTSNLMYKGNILKNVSVGGYVKIIKGFTKIIGKVEGEYVKEVLHKKEFSTINEKINRVLTVSLLGFFKDGKFERGIKELPLIDNECYLLEKNEFDNVHSFIKDNDIPISIGTLALEKNQKISIGINSLFASHIGIFGNTGSGKSYTLAKLYHELYKKYGGRDNFKKNSKFVLFDFNGEYESKNAIVTDEFKSVYSLSTRNENDKIPILEENIYDPNLWIVLLEATEKTQTPFLRRAVSNRYLEENIRDEASLKTLIKDKIEAIVKQDIKVIEKGLVTNFLSELSGNIDSSKVSGFDELIADYTSHLSYHNNGNSFYYTNGNSTLFSDSEAFVNIVITEKVNRLEIKADELSTIEVIRLKIIIQYYDDVIRGFSNKEHLAPLIKRLDKRISDLYKVVNVVNEITEEKNFVVISLHDVNIQMKKILPLLFCKQYYDKKKEENNSSTYLNLIIDEAHNILSRSSERESEQWKDYRLETFEEIIKEGRKFGVFLTLASQRPSDISPTIISQLHNYFLHRLINNNDIIAVEKTISYLDKVSFEYLPILPTGTCILAGLSAQVPVVIDIDPIEEKFEPDNKTIFVIEHWDDD